jgi:hypothetical protein
LVIYLKIKKMLTAALMGLLQEAFKRKAYSASGWTRLLENAVTLNVNHLAGKKKTKYGYLSKIWVYPKNN